MNTSASILIVEIVPGGDPSTGWSTGIFSLTSSISVSLIEGCKFNPRHAVLSQCERAVYAERMPEMLESHIRSGECEVVRQHEGFKGTRGFRRSFSGKGRGPAKGD